MIKKLLLLILIGSLISGCGWRLRGALALPSDLNTLYVTAEDAHGRLVRELRRALSSRDVKLVGSASEAQFSIEILDERNRRRVVSVGNNALAAEYELKMEVEYSIQPQGVAGAGLVSTASVIRSFSFDENNVIGKAEEEQLIEEEMRHELVQQIVRRLQVIAKSTPAAEPNHETATTSPTT